MEHTVSMVEATLRAEEEHFIEEFLLYGHEKIDDRKNEDHFMGF